MLELFLIGVAVGTGNAATALSLGALGQGHKRLRIALTFAFFEFLVPLVGMLVGRQLALRFETFTLYLASALLLALGVWILRAAFRDAKRDEGIAERAASPKGLITLALVLSFDNLVVGFSLGMAVRDPLRVSLAIGVFAFVFSYLGVTLGARVDRRWERDVQALAGFLLIGLAVATFFGWL